MGLSPVFPPSNCGRLVELPSPSSRSTMMHNFLCDFEGNGAFFFNAFLPKLSFLRSIFLPLERMSVGENSQLLARAPRGYFQYLRPRLGEASRQTVCFCERNRRKWEVGPAAASADNPGLACAEEIRHSFPPTRSLFRLS